MTTQSFCGLLRDPVYELPEFLRRLEQLDQSSYVFTQELGGSEWMIEACLMPSAQIHRNDLVADVEVSIDTWGELGAFCLTDCNVRYPSTFSEPQAVVDSFDGRYPRYVRFGFPVAEAVDPYIYYNQRTIEMLTWWIEHGLVGPIRLVRRNRSLEVQEEISLVPNDDTCAVTVRTIPVTGGRPARYGWVRELLEEVSDEPALQ